MCGSPIVSGPFVIIECRSPAGARQEIEASAQRALGHRLGVPEKTIQAILRHANVSTTNMYYIKSVADDARAAMAKLETLVMGNETAAAAEKQAQSLSMDNKVATEPLEALSALIQ